MGFQTVDQGFFFVQEELDEDLAVPLVPCKQVFSMF